jgi:hypothetical protein
VGEALLLDGLLAMEGVLLGELDRLFPLEGSRVRGGSFAPSGHASNCVSMLSRPEGEAAFFMGELDLAGGVLNASISPLIKAACKKRLVSTARDLPSSYSPLPLCLRGADNRPLECDSVNAAKNIVKR